MEKEIKDALFVIALELARTKEIECGNSGANWLDEFIEEFMPENKDRLYPFNRIKRTGKIIRKDKELEFEAEIEND